MKNILKYLIFLLADLIVVGAIVGSVVRTIVYGIAGEENHHIYMIIRLILIISVFLIGCLIINTKDASKMPYFRDNKEIMSVVNGKLSYRYMILHSKVFMNDIISFVAFMFLLFLIMVFSMYRLGGALFVILDIVVTLVVIGIYCFANYKLTYKILDEVVVKKRKSGELNENENKH